LLAIYRLKYKPSDVEIEEFKLMLEMMPDRPILKIPKIGEIDWPSIQPKPNPYEWPVTVMYGVPIPPYTTTGKQEVSDGENER